MRGRQSRQVSWRTRRGGSNADGDGVMDMTARERVIVALDVDTEAQARAIVNALGDAAHAYKIGLQLLTAAGPGLMRELAAAGKCVFLDLKLFEIPTSVAGAVRAAATQGAKMVTVHASAGAVILRAAVEAARPWPGLKVLALTVVTSLNDADLREVGVEAGTAAQTVRLARLAETAGCHGVVASAHEVGMLRDLLGPQMLRVTPGVRWRGGSGQGPAQSSAPSTTNTSMRSTSPVDAFRASATHIVIGRSITQADDPRAAFDAVCAECAEALARAGVLT